MNSKASDHDFQDGDFVKITADETLLEPHRGGVLSAYNKFIDDIAGNVYRFTKYNLDDEDRIECTASKEWIIHRDIIEDVFTEEEKPEYFL